MTQEQAIQRLQESVIPGITRRSEQLWKIINSGHFDRQDEIDLRRAATALEDAEYNIHRVLKTTKTR